ncbi:MAG: hypothetical protein JW722_01055 [Demequinaceae bacterium]|nr:hypothetical protein [Demequinaceae bacterium]
MTEAESTPPEPSHPTTSAPRPFSGLRFLRVFRKKAVFVPLLAALMVGVDAWLVVTLDRWEGDAEHLRTEAAELGRSIGETDASIEEAESEIAMLSTQQSTAALRADELADEAAGEQALSDAFRDVALDLEECVTDRFAIVTGLWNHGRAFVASLATQTASECAAAQATLDRLIKEID